MLAAIHPLDLGILISFLAVTLVVGLNYGKQIKTIQDYALGGKNFSTSTLVATIVATFASGSGFFVNLENTYTSGLYFLIPLSGMLLQLWLNGRLAIRMGEFMNHVSVAEAMGSMYGKTVQIITALSGIMAKTGFMAIQFKIIARVLVVLFNMESHLATIMSASIVIFYSAFGGIKAVTFTDILQFFTFGAVLPALALVIWNSVKNSSDITATLADYPMFHLSQVVGWHPQFFSAVGLLLYATIPHFQPELFQRIAMARDPIQARRALTYSAAIYFLIQLIIAWISILILVEHPGLAKEHIFPYIVNKYTYPGIKGVLGAGLIALTMSTADSSLNSISVMFANDFIKPLMRKSHASVATARAFSFASGFFALFLALYNQDLLKLVLLSISLYMPIFSVPMLLAVLGFRTTTRVVLRGMSAGFISVILWSFFFNNADSIIPSMGANLAVLLASHYLLGEPGGWKKVTLIK